MLLAKWHKAKIYWKTKFTNELYGNTTDFLQPIHKWYRGFRADIQVGWYKLIESQQAVKRRREDITDFL